MNNKDHLKKDLQNDNSYLPVPYVCLETIEEEITKGTKGKIFYFDGENNLESFEGEIKSLQEIKNEGMFVMTNPAYQIRIDRIITIFGKPGAAFEEYDNYANQCLSCTGGYDL